MNWIVAWLWIGVWFPYMGLQLWLWWWVDPNTVWQTQDWNTWQWQDDSDIQTQQA